MAHKPTDENRKLVEQLSGVGLPQEMICLLIDDGISVETMVKYYGAELKRGKAKACAKVGNALFQKCMNGDTASILFWCKTQMGFREVSQMVVENNQPLKITIERDNGSI